MQQGCVVCANVDVTGGQSSSHVRTVDNGSTPCSESSLKMVQAYTDNLFALCTLMCCNHCELVAMPHTTAVDAHAATADEASQLRHQLKVRLYTIYSEHCHAVRHSMPHSALRFRCVSVYMHM
jgi:hypothetical protein